MNRLIVLVATLAFAFTVIGCGGGEQVKEPDVGAGMFVDASNKELAKYPVEGFGYKSSEMPSRQWNNWSRAAAPVVERITDQMPDGYVLQVTGHTCSIGPERPVGDKPGNIKLSENRAKTVFNALERQGISSDVLTFKGVGSSEPKSGVARDSSQQRRVTFKVVPK